MIHVWHQVRSGEETYVVPLLFYGYIFKKGSNIITGFGNNNNN